MALARHEHGCSMKKLEAPADDGAESEWEEREEADDQDADDQDDGEADAQHQEAHSSLRDEWRTIRPSLLFIGAWVLLNVLVNVRYPDAEPAFWYLTPAIDVCVIFVAYALLGLKEW